jgi:DNA ligase (NAD+)
MDREGLLIEGFQENATFEELIAVDEIGEKIAQSILRFFANDQCHTLIARLKEAGLQMEIVVDESIEHTDKLAGKSIVISGVFAQHSRNEYKAMIEQHGGTNVSSISSKTSFILAGRDMGPAKLEKAQKLGVLIVSEEEFLGMLE